MKPIKIGERIRYYRSLLNISREELANEQMSINLIKYIECGSKNLTFRKAIILAEIINKIAVNKGIQLFVTSKDLIEPEEECARRFCWEELKKIDNQAFDEKEYDTVLGISKKYALNEILIYIYDKIASNYFKIGKYELSIAFLQKVIGLGNSFNNVEYIVKALNTLGSCYYMLNDDLTALEYFKMGYQKYISIQMDDRTLESKILYNLALISKKINKYEDTLMYLEKLLLMKTYDKTSYIKGMILKANIYLERYQYNDALNMYKLISEYSPNYLYIVHHNMAIAFIKLNKTEESIDYLTKSISAQLNYQSPILTMSLINMGIIYKNENLLRPSIVFFEHTIDNAIAFNQFDELIESIDSLKELYEKVGTPQQFNHIRNKIDKYIKLPSIPPSQIERLEKYAIRGTIK